LSGKPESNECRDALLRLKNGSPGRIDSQAWPMAQDIARGRNFVIDRRVRDFSLKINTYLKMRRHYLKPYLYMSADNHAIHAEKVSYLQTQYMLR
jgi:hypothetical protein